MKLAICDDDRTFLDKERKLIEEALRDIGVDYTISAFVSPLELTGCGERFDIVFLDVEMDGMTGIEAADAIHGTDSATLIFFVTNYEGYMDEALNRHAFRFWVKPINPQRLIYGLESAIREINNAKVSINVTIDRKLQKINMRSIIYVCARNKKTCIVTTDSEVEVKEPFKNIIARLNASCFAPSHASYYVNLEYVIKYTKDEVIMRYKDKTYSAYMSKRKYAAFSGAFIRWAGEHV